MAVLPSPAFTDTFLRYPERGFWLHIPDEFDLPELDDDQHKNDG
jgi:hypothetical protein